MMKKNLLYMARGYDLLKILRQVISVLIYLVIHMKIPTDPEDKWGFII